MVDGSEMPLPLLALQDVSRVYGKAAKATHSLRSVSLEIFPGEFVAIIGPSGAGKSTLMNILGLLDTPTDGTYLFDGADTRVISQRERDRIRNERIGFVFQDSHMLLDDTAAGNAALALHVRGVPMAARRSQVGGALAMLGIKHRETELAGTLSGGERQRVAIARAIAANPTLILADEPTGALDTANTQNTIDHLRRLNDSGTTVVVITHDQTVAAAAKRRIEIIDGVVHDDARIGSSVVPTSERVGDHPLPHGRFGSRVVGEVFASLSGLCSNVGRTLLLLLAFALGAGGLVASVGISESATNQIAERLTAASLDEVTVRLADPGAYEAGLYDAGSHISAAIRSLPHVRRLGFVASLPRTTAEVRLLPPTVPGPSFAGTVIVAGAGYLATQGATVVPAHAAAILDNTWNGSVALVGKDAARQLGISSVGPGSLLWLGERSVDVIGIIDDAGRDERLTDSVVLSSAAARGLTADDPRLIVRTESGGRYRRSDSRRGPTGPAVVCAHRHRR